MDAQRLILSIIFSLSSLMLWQAWQKHEQPSTETATVTAPVKGNPSTVGAGAPVPGTQQWNSANTPAAAPASAFPVGPQAIVSTDLFDATINAAGGDIRNLTLKQYGDTTRPGHHLHLFEQQPDHLFVAQSGLVGPGLPTHKSMFTLQPGNHELQPGQDTLSLVLNWDDAQSGMQVQKTYVFHRGSYRIDVLWNIVNRSNTNVSVDAYYQFVRDGKPPVGESRVVHTFTGPAIYTQASKFVKLDFHKLDKGEQEYPKFANNGWLAMVQHHFVSVWLPPNGGNREFFARPLGDGLYSAGVILPEGRVAPGGSLRLDVPLYAGPQIQKVLTALAPGLDYVVDYGWLTPIAVPIFWVLQHIHAWVGNWGWAIVILTIGIKLLFFPLSAKSYRSMAQMRGLSPKLQRLKEQYGDDREKLHLAMMELYKTEKVNPLGGCLPTVVQIPVFIALYWTLVGSVEMRQAPFIGWIHDLSAPDPFYVLPIIMGLTMLLQTRLNPAPPDPMQAKMMMIMPVAFTAFFLFFPSGLVLYWVVNNTMSILQQWVITRKFDASRAR